MMYEEFLETAKQTITFEQYAEIIEPMYNATKMSKEQFVEFIMPSIKELAKQNKAKEIECAPVVFISDGRRTDNGSYYIGERAKVISTDVDVATGKTTVRVRKLTEDERRAAGGDDRLGTHMDYNTNVFNVVWVK